VVDFGISLGAPTAEAVPDRHSYYRDLLARGEGVFTSAWVSDHLMKDDDPVLEAWTTIAYLAAEFPSYTVGNLVLSQSYRNPALLAKMAATLQFLTDGRLVLGIGAGWLEDEYHAYGYEYPSRKIRVDQLAEALLIITTLWHGGPATFSGAHYSITNAYCHPVPSTPIPIMIGSGGPRVMRLAAEHADAWNWDAIPDRFEPLHAQMVANLVALGRTRESLMISANVTVDFPDDPETFVGVEETDFPEYDNDQIIYGPTPEAAIAALRPFVDGGVTHFQVSPSDLRTLRLFAAEVAPALAG
jgi:alkanesulfonate monooxygenase SsuD/methylene tetrahydromethanopterin reductase-like flavin-dependent oxidoreductase (luciferase family)